MQNFRELVVVDKLITTGPVNLFNGFAAYFFSRTYSITLVL
jgi:hypothetical protein